MTNSFIGQVGDVNNHKQDFEKLHVCFCVFKNRCLLAQLRGRKKGGAGKGQGWWRVEERGQEEINMKKKKRARDFFEAIGNIMLRFRLLHKQIRFN